jgi:hypothetical protein
VRIFESSSCLPATVCGRIGLRVLACVALAVGVATLAPFCEAKAAESHALAMHGAPLTLPLPLAGEFAKAYDGPPTDPKVFEENQKKLQEELQKRAEDARKKLEQNQPAGATPNPAAK